MAADHDSRGDHSASDPVVGPTGARFGGVAERRSRTVVQPPEGAGIVAAHHHGLSRSLVEPANGARLP